MTRRRVVWTSTALILIVAVVGGPTGCLKQLVDVAPPSDTITSAGINTVTQAEAVYAAAVLQFAGAFGGVQTVNPTTPYIIETGALTDELLDVNGPGLNALDARTADTGSSGSGAYDALQASRVQARLATIALRKFTASPPSTVAESYMLEGYSELLLAEYICSGIPLSTVNFGGGITYSPGLTTTQALEVALAHFDTASTYAGSPSVQVGVSVGRGRAWLDLGDYDSAAAAVVNVPTSGGYAVEYGTQPNLQNQVYLAVDYGTQTALIVSNDEGENGLNFVSAQDPRVPTTTTGPYVSFNGLTSYTSPIVLASGVEGQLIQAEAALSHGTPAWLDMLNALRTDGTYTTAPDATNPNQLDTTYNAGTGGVAGLAPLTDPGTPTARVDLVFRERAFWMYLTGHREGDLRRLVRQYGRPQETVYPIGPYILPVPKQGVPVSYGSQVVGIPDANEQRDNPLYHGCFNFGA
jgi:starch-binding outer membrane protein, SusD/RagB family